MTDLVRRSRVLDLIAGKKEPAFVIIVGHAPRLADENMLDSRHGRLRLLAEHTNIDRHLAPPEEKEPALLEHILCDRLGPRLGVGIVVRQKHHADRKIRFLVQRVTQSGDLGNKKLVRNLGDQSGAIPCLRIGIKRPAVH